MQPKVAAEHRELQEGHVRVEVQKERNDALKGIPEALGEIPEALERLAEVLFCKSKVFYL